jgi:catechol 2,3-dioxygenase-like lactoylglutathione lyase family enzyme
MQVNALDHVNIITDRLEESAAFYAALLDLRRGDAPPPLTPQNAQWMYDAGGKAILHLNSVDCPRTFERQVEPGELTGSIHHVALNCSGYDQVIARLDASGAQYKTNTVVAVGVRQVFTADPSNVLLELNFFGD